jgi:hypothetical protein
VEAPSRFIGPNVLICAGLLPFLLWALAVSSTVKYGLGLTDLFLAGLFGVGTYLLTAAIFAAGLLWTNRRAEKLHIPPPTTNRILVNVAWMVLLAPWVLVLGRAVFSSMR